ncbi:MAG: hypothetical protein KGJ89_01715 [Patescibacteria group bacterium]|nr:hypothetical protein [Patescibacteria group bacterium]MDE2015595.1 hypothetical protein [Patescibacteria group bacterium]MDE2226652.1 hypothetical protein [Patescibacteria group bacterium]
MLIGHEKIVEDLKKLASGGKLAHGYIFFGLAMTGKRTTAIQFANFLEAKNGPDIVLQDCLLIGPDEKGTLGIDAVRSLKNFLWQKPNVSSKRTAILDGAENMTGEARNALLKIAEEPPPSTLLILITSDIESIGETVSSRLQKIYFSPVKNNLISEWLCAEIGLPKKTAEELAARSGGRPGFAYDLAKDKKFKESIDNAEKFLKLSADKGRDFIKKLVEPDDFSLVDFMDFLILLAAESGIKNKKSTERWHKLLKLRYDAAYLNLNPRLQLENLLYSAN